MSNTKNITVEAIDNFGHALDLEIRVLSAIERIIARFKDVPMYQDLTIRFSADKPNSKQKLPFRVVDNGMNNALVVEIYYPEFLNDMDDGKRIATILTCVVIAQVRPKDRFNNANELSKTVKDALKAQDITLRKVEKKNVFFATTKLKEWAKSYKAELDVIMSQKLSDNWKAPKVSDEEAPKRTKLICSASCEAYIELEPNFKVPIDKVNVAQKMLGNCGACGNAFVSMATYKATQDEKTKVKELIQTS